MLKQFWTMIRTIPIVLIFFLIHFGLQAQMTVKGKVTDTLGTSLQSASVFLLDDLDSTLLDFVRSEEDGSFLFKNVSRRNYILKLNYIGYLPRQIAIGKEQKEIDLGAIQLSQISKELFEVVIKEAKAPLSIKGDTIEYDASTFKVPPGSSVEELLRKLPGLEVDAEGGLKSEGKDIKRVTVDGKRFFGGDPKAATKNLPAEGVKKVQIFTDASEEQLASGSKANADKAMNIELKESFKKGGFGKVTAGVGTEETAEIKANYNKFNKKEQFSFIGVANNTGRNGLGWNDYQDFKGSNSFNWDDSDDFGFGSSGRYRYFYSDDGESEDDENLGEQFWGGNASGFPKKLSGGVNYNYDHKKSNLSTSYFYSFNNLLTNSFRKNQYLIPDRPYSVNDTTLRDRTKMNHAVSLRYEFKIDSMNTIVAIANTDIGQAETEQEAHSLTNTESLQQRNAVNQFTLNNSDVVKWNSSVIYRKKFKKKGRKFSLSGGYNGLSLDKTYDLKSGFAYYWENPIRDSLFNINQNTPTINDRKILKSSALFVEPIAGKFFLQTFYNFNHRIEDNNRNVYDLPDLSTRVFNDSLSRSNDQTAQLNRVGSSIRYSHEGINLSIGVAVQEMALRGKYFSGTNKVADDLNKNFQNIIPHLSFDFNLKRNQNVSVEYNGSVNELNLKDLQAITDYTSPRFIRKGNPNLTPEFNHNASVRFNKFNSATFTNIYAGVNYTYTENKIVRRQNTDLLNITTSEPINYKFANSIWANLGYGFPIIKNKYTLNFSYNYSYNQNFLLINQSEGTSKTNGHGGGIRLNITPNDNFSCFVNTNIRFNSVQYVDLAFNNQELINQNHSIDLNYKFPKNIFLNSNFKLNVYSNDQFDNNQNVPLLNLSVYKVFLKDQKGELRLSAYDLFNQNIGLNQSAYGNTITESRTETLARYVMLSFTYNMRGIKTSLKKNNNFWE